MNEHISFIQNTAYLVLFVATLQWFGVDALSTAILGIMIVIDVITGILRSGFVDGWRTIQSNRLQRGLVAKLLIILLPLLVALCGKGIGMNLAAFAQACLNVLILSEVYSILGNIYSLRTGKVRSEFDAISYVIGQVQEFLKKIIIQDGI